MVVVRLIGYTAHLLQLQRWQCSCPAAAPQGESIELRDAPDRAHHRCLLGHSMSEPPRCMLAFFSALQGKAFFL